MQKNVWLDACKTSRQTSSVYQIFLVSTTATTHGNITNLLTGISSRCHNSYIYLKLSIVIDVQNI